MKTKSSLATVAAICALASPSANAALTLVYSTGFSSPTYADGVLNVGTDTTTAGQDGWLSSSGGGTNNISVANSATNGTVTLATSGQDIRRAFTAVTPGNGTSVYLKAEFTVASAQTTGDYFLHLGDGGISNFYARTYIKSTTGGFLMALGTGAGAVTYGTTVLSLNTPYTVLVRYDFATGLLNDTGALFINPITEDGVGETPYVAATTIGGEPTTIGSVHLRQGAAGSSAGVTVDSITFAVPEPASAVLGAFGLLGILRRRR